MNSCNTTFKDELNAFFKGTTNSEKNRFNPIILDWFKSHQIKSFDDLASNPDLLFELWSRTEVFDMYCSQNSIHQKYFDFAYFKLFEKKSENTFYQRRVPNRTLVEFFKTIKNNHELFEVDREIIRKFFTCKELNLIFSHGMRFCLDVYSEKIHSLLSLYEYEEIMKLFPILPEGDIGKKEVFLDFCNNLRVARDFLESKPDKVLKGFYRRELLIFFASQATKYSAVTIALRSFDTDRKRRDGEIVTSLDSTFIVSYFEVLKNLLTSLQVNPYVYIDLIYFLLES